MSSNQEGQHDVPMEEAFIALTRFHALQKTPLLPILTQGDAAQLPDLLTSKDRLILVLERNRLTHSQIEGQLAILRDVEPPQIRLPDADEPPTNQQLRAYTTDARTQLRAVETVIGNQEHSLQLINNMIQRHTPTLPANDADTQKDDNKPFVKVPDNVTKFGRSGLRNANEYLTTFITQIEASSRHFDPTDGVTLGRYLSQVIEDVNLRQSFSQDFNATTRARHPERLTVEEIKAIFLKHCGKVSDYIETSKRLLGITPKPGELFTDYGKRTELEWQRSGTKDDCPAIVSHLEGTVPPTACTIMRLWYLVHNLYTVTGHPKPKIPPESFLVWREATFGMEGKVEDYGSHPNTHSGSSTYTRVSEHQRNEHHNKRQWSSPPSNNSFKRVKLDASTNSSLTSTSNLTATTNHPNTTNNSNKCELTNAELHCAGNAKRITLTNTVR
ncbi:MAG: hypothetical protein J3Q66DRAFT_367464 [Benniella sp.]|nr:MAG: hypothetical protein J3Q66DRAFT_367464 [Benniella sp.]